MKWARLGAVLAVFVAAIAAQAQSGKAYLGIYGEDPPSESKDKGAMVKEVSPDGPAAKAGLKVGDRIIAVDDQEIMSFEDLKVRLGGFKAGDKPQFKVIRDGKEMVLQATLEEMPTRRPSPRPSENGPGFRFRIPFGENLPEGLEDQIRQQLRGVMPESGPMIGVQAQPIDEELRERLGLGKDVKGVLVAEVLKGGPADKAGIESEDVLVSVDDTMVESPEKLKEIVHSKKEGDSLKVRLVRDGKEMDKEVRVEVSARPAMPLGGMFDSEEMNSRLEQFRKGLDDLNKRREELQGRMSEMEKKAAESAQKGLESLEKRIAELEKSSEARLKEAGEKVRQLEEKLADLAKRLEEKSKSTP